MRTSESHLNRLRIEISNHIGSFTTLWYSTALSNYAPIETNKEIRYFASSILVALNPIHTCRECYTYCLIKRTPYLSYSRFYIIIGVSLKNLLRSNYKLYKELDYLKKNRRHKAVYSTLLIIQCEVGHL